MKISSYSKVLTVAFLQLILCSPFLQAECFTLFQDLESGGTIQCANAGFGADIIIDGIFEPEILVDKDTGILQADFDGFELFEEGGAPDNLIPPFFANTQVVLDGPASMTPSFSIQHRGSASISAIDAEFVDSFYDTKSFITFTPETDESGIEEVDITLRLSHNFKLQDDPPGDGTTGSSLGGMAMTVTGPEGPVFSFDGLAELDFDSDPEPEFFGDFDGAAFSSPSGPDSADVVLTQSAVIKGKPNEPMTIESSTFGSIFSDGFESGDVSVWSSSSPDTAVIVVQSGDPRVTFNVVVPEPSSAALVAWTVFGLLFVRRRRC